MECSTVEKPHSIIQMRKENRQYEKESIQRLTSHGNLTIKELSEKLSFGLSQEWLPDHDLSPKNNTMTLMRFPLRLSLLLMT